MGQESNALDSLIAACTSYPTADTNKVKMLIQTAHNIRRTYPNKGLELSNQAFELAQSLGEGYWMATANKTKAFNLFNLGQRTEAIDLLKNTALQFERLGYALEHAQITFTIGLFYSYISANSEAIPWFDKAKPLYESVGDQAGVARSYLQSGYMKTLLSDLTGALKDLEKSESINSKINNLSGLEANYNHLGLLYSQLSKYQKALEYYFKAQRINEKTGDQENLAHVFTNVGSLYYSLSDYDKALEYDHQALSIYQNLGLTFNEGMTRVNIATRFFNRQEYDKALEYNLLGLKLLEPLQAWEQIGICLSNIGLVYLNTKKFEQAFEYHQKALDIFKQLDNKMQMSRMQINLGALIRDADDMVLLKNGISPEKRCEKAEELLSEGIKQAELTHNVYFIEKAALELSISYEKCGNYIKAYKAYKLSASLRDSLSGEDVRNQISRKEIEYEFERKQATLIYENNLALEQLEQEKLIAFQNRQALQIKEQALFISNKENDLKQLAYLKEKAEKQEKEQLLALAEKDKLVQSLQLGDLIYEKSQQMRALAEKNIVITLLGSGLLILLLGFLAFYARSKQKLAQKQAFTQIKFTNQLLENIEEERKRIAFDLHDSISHDLLALKQFTRSPEVTPAGTGKKIDDIINEVRDISKNLHPVMLDKIGLKLSLETLCDQFMNNETLFVSHQIEYSKQLPKATELQIFRIVQEALSNVLKYANAEAVRVKLTETGTRLSLEIKDNGKGFDVAKALESGKSFGLKSILQRANAIGGKAEFISGETGTVVLAEFQPNGPDNKNT
jgi:signal transduction histidine kinase